MHPEISIIAPFYNEADNIEPLVREIVAALRNEKRPYEIVLVDDCSTDETPERLREVSRAEPRVRVLRHVRNQGQSAALWTGFRCSTSPIIATLDGDRQNDPADFPALLAKLDEFDLVCGVRAKRRDSRLRLLSTAIARRANRLALGSVFQDPGCGLRVFKRPVLEGLFAFNGFHRFMAVLVKGGGWRVGELPVNHRPRVAGVSKYGVWNRMGRGVFDLIGVAWFQRRRIVPAGLSTPESPGTPPGSGRGGKA